MPSRSIRRSNLSTGAAGSDTSLMDKSVGPPVPLENRYLFAASSSAAIDQVVEGADNHQAGNPAKVSQLSQGWKAREGNRTDCMTVMRPSERMKEFLRSVRGDEDAVDWLEKVLFIIGGG